MHSRDILYLTEDDVKRSIDMPDAIVLAEKGIHADAAGRVAGDKFYMHTDSHSFIKPFAGFLEGEELAYVKTFSFVAENSERGLPVTDTVALLFDATTGFPVCLMEANWITALKTGASTAVTAKSLARRDSKIATIFGAGSLGRMHLLGLCEVFDLEEVRVVDVIPEIAGRFQADMSEQAGVPVTVSSSPETAVRGADIIVTVTTGSAINVEVSWLKLGAFVARMGSYQEVALDLFLKADKLVVDRWEYVSYRVPEMVELIDAGRLKRDDLHAEWPDVVGGRATGRESDEEIILYTALGIWGEYAAILPEVYRAAKRLGLGRKISG